jgi:hypothetical protein
MERSARITPGTSSDRDLRRALGDFAAATVRLPSVDPVTTEIVRLRCAHHHDCGT